MGRPLNAVVTLWDWAGAAWTRPGVESVCLTLQDDHGQCVPLLFWAIWRWENGGDLGDGAAQRAVSLCLSMNSVIAPLRAARRDAPPADRERLLENELKAEHELIDQLEAMSVDHASPTNVPAHDWLSLISTFWGSPLDPHDFDSLLKALLIREPADVR